MLSKTQQPEQRSMNDPSAAKLNGMVERKLAEDLADRDRRSAAVRGLRRQASEVAAGIASAELRQAEKATQAASEAVATAERALAERQAEFDAAQAALSRTEEIARNPALVSL